MGFSGWFITPVVAQSSISKHQLVSQTGLSLNPSSAWPPCYEQIMSSPWATVSSIWNGNVGLYVYRAVVRTKYNHICKALCVEHLAHSKPPQNGSWTVKEISRLWLGTGGNWWHGCCPDLSEGTYWDSGAIRGIIKMPGMTEESRHGETLGWFWPIDNIVQCGPSLQLRSLGDLDSHCKNSLSGCLKNEKLPEYPKKAFPATSPVFALSHVINMDWMSALYQVPGIQRQ